MQEFNNAFAMNFSPLHTNRVIFHSRMIPENFYPREFLFMRHILYRQYLNMNSFILIVGAVRTGKTYFGLKFMEEYYRVKRLDFHVKEHCSFDVKPFLYWSKDHMDDIYLLDEIQANLSPQSWYETLSKVFNTFCQTQGFRRNILIMTLPNVAFLLKSIRFMTNFICETRNQGSIFIRKVNMNHSLGKGYLTDVQNINFKLPMETTINKYESMKKDWNDKRLSKDIDWLELLEQPDEREIKRQKYYDLRTRKLELDIKAKENRLKGIIPKKEIQITEPIQPKQANWN